MSDKFGRNQSTRWVKASIPTYGDEWGDDYDYDYRSGGESETEHSQPQTQPEGPHNTEKNDQESQYGQCLSEVNRLDKNDNREIDTATEQNNPNLILSIDRLRTSQFISDDSSSENEDGPEIMEEKERPYLQSGGENFVTGDDETQLRTKKLSDANEDSSTLSSGNPINQIVLTENKQHGRESDLFPPTPTFNTTDRTDKSLAETPKSDRSYQSDADSIQNEPSDLNIRYPRKYDSHFGNENVDTHEVLEEIPESKALPKEAESFKKKDQNHELNETRSDENIISPTDNESEAPAPLVLSIDQKKYGEDDSSDDDWGYNSQKDSDDEQLEKDGYNVSDVEQPHSEDLNQDADHDQHNLPEEVDSSHRHKTDALDSLIKDLQNASHSGKNDEHAREPGQNGNSGQDELFLNMDSLQNISLPDFENNSFSQYDGEDNKGLNIKTVLPNEDEEYPPPTPIAPLSFQEESRGHEDFITGLTGHRRSIRKPPPNPTTAVNNRNELVSVDYTNIADAVSGYMNDDASNKKIDLDSRDSEIERLPDVPETEDNKNENRDFESDLHPTISTVSSGSLSTGRFSFDASNSAPQMNEESKNENTSKENEDVSRRISTMSADTISMGNWKPNTNNYRDQFINDNDNESHINFNPYAESSSNYNKFTKMRTVSGASFDSPSNASSQSVPETIDAALPSVHEGPDNHDTAINDSDNSLEVARTINTTDSVLKEPHFHPQVFEEEKVTPISSKDDLLKSTTQEPQKYSSLLGPAADETDNNSDTIKTKSSSSLTSSKETTLETGKKFDRFDSESSAVTGTTKQSTSRSFTPQPYNLYNWKSIMATSQPIDRIRLLKDALQKEADYDSGLQNWLNESLRQSEDASNIHIGKIATQAYQNAAHNDIRRHASIRSKVSIVRDKVETSGLQASSLGKRFFNRGKKLMKSSGNE